MNTFRAVLAANGKHRVHVSSFASRAWAPLLDSPFARQETQVPTQIAPRISAMHPAASAQKSLFTDSGARSHNAEATKRRTTPCRRDASLNIPLEHTTCWVNC